MFSVLAFILSIFGYFCFFYVSFISPIFLETFFYVLFLYLLSQKLFLLCVLDSSINRLNNVQCCLQFNLALVLSVFCHSCSILYFLYYSNFLGNFYLFFSISSQPRLFFSLISSVYVLGSSITHVELSQKLLFSYFFFYIFLV